MYFCHFLFRKMADMAFHSKAIERLYFACGNIIMKNAHLTEPSLFQNIIEAFPSNITTVENISPRGESSKLSLTIMLLAAGREVVSKTSAYNITKLSYRVEVRVR